MRKLVLAAVTAAALALSPAAAGVAEARSTEYPCGSKTDPSSGGWCKTQCERYGGWVPSPWYSETAGSCFVVKRT
jgi:hypothetical protein